jgi:uncharacterized protein YndB with AHSA1/START domain
MVEGIAAAELRPMDGTISGIMSDKLRGYAHRVDIVADAEKVWLALTKPEYLKRWCSPAADIKARPGGLFRASVDRVLELEAHIDVCEPGRRLRLIYLPSSELPPTDSAIIDDVILDATPPETIVRLLGSGIPSTPDWDAQYRRLRLGWQAAMTRLKVFVERQMAAGASTGTG